MVRRRTPADHREVVRKSRKHARPEIADVLNRWRGHPVSALAVFLALTATTALVVAIGGPPTPFTHLFYLAVRITAR
jgi:hypothetical protein